jgi:hypothetical protein
MLDSTPKLISGEHVVYSSSKHWASVVTSSVWAIALILGALLVGWIQPDATGGVLGFFNRTLELLRLGLFLAGLGWIVYNVVVWRTAEYSVTNRRVLGHEGFMRQRSTDTLLTSVSDIRTATSVLGRLLNYGNVRILSAAGESGKDELTAISNAEQFKQAVLEQKAGSGALAAAAGPPAPVSARSAATVDTGQVITQIVTNLTTLRDAGVLTDAEFNSMRADWLRRL